MWSCPGCARLDAVLLKIVWALLLVGCSVQGVGARAWGQTSVDGAIDGFVVDASGAGFRQCLLRWTRRFIR
jgi:hypothetical protein